MRYATDVDRSQYDVGRYGANTISTEVRQQSEATVPGGSGHVNGTLQNILCALCACVRE